jgi:hypothetical protein
MKSTIPNPEIANPQIPNPNPKSIPTHKSPIPIRGRARPWRA